MCSTCRRESLVILIFDLVTIVYRTMTPFLIWSIYQLTNPFHNCSILVLVFLLSFMGYLTDIFYEHFSLMNLSLEHHLTLRNYTAGQHPGLDIGLRSKFRFYVLSLRILLRPDGAFTYINRSPKERWRTKLFCWLVVIRLIQLCRNMLFSVNLVW